LKKRKEREIKKEMKGTVEELLCFACDDGDLNQVKQLLINNNLQVNLNCENDSGRTPLYIVCENGNIEIVKVLLLMDGKVDINKLSQNGQTSFFIACKNGHIEVVKLLLNDERVNVNIPNDDDQTPLWIACENNQIEIVKMLLNDLRVKINEVDEEGMTPFHIACIIGYIEIVKLLFNNERVDLNKASLKNQTPIYTACFFGHIEIVKYILSSGREVNLNVKDSDGNTAIDIARKRGKFTEEKRAWETEGQYQKRINNCPKIVELLESFERNPNETRFKLRMQLGLTGKFNFDFVSISFF